MWKQLLDSLWQALRLAEDTERNRQNIKELEKTQRDFAKSMEQEVYELRRAIERLATALERLSEREETERKILKLELENMLLRQERGLPPAKQLPSAEPEADKLKEHEEKADD